LDRFDIINFPTGKYILRAVVLNKMLNHFWFLVRFYDTTQEEDKEEFLAELATMCSNQSFPLLIGRDFNLLR
jgi:hypothetical protein